MQIIKALVLLKGVVQERSDNNMLFGYYMLKITVNVALSYNLACFPWNKGTFGVVYVS